MDEIELRRKRLTTGAKWAIGLVGAALISPVIFYAVKGLIGLALAFVVGMTIIYGAPVLAMKFANWRLRSIKHEARTNPIETLQNQYVDRQQALSRFKDSITDFATEVGNFGDRVADFKKRYPEEAPKFKGQHDKMVALLKLRQSKYQDAVQELEAFRLEIQKANAIWEMSLAAQKMNKAAGLQTGDVFEQIKTETAVDSVQSSLNRAFAELETSLLDHEEEDHPPLLEEKQSVKVIDITPKKTSHSA